MHSINLTVATLCFWIYVLPTLTIVCSWFAMLLMALSAKQLNLIRSLLFSSLLMHWLKIQDQKIPYELSHVSYTQSACIIYSLIITPDRRDFRWVLPLFTLAFERTESLLAFDCWFVCSFCFFQFQSTISTSSSLNLHNLRECDANRLVLPSGEYHRSKFHQDNIIIG